MNERRKPKSGWGSHEVWDDAAEMFPRSPEIMAEMHAWAFAQNASEANRKRQAKWNVRVAS